MEKSLELLQSAQMEIKILRRRNELMSARLEMFDSINAILHTQVAYSNTGMSPDIVCEIDKYIDSQKVNNV